MGNWRSRTRCTQISQQEYGNLIGEALTDQSGITYKVVV
jgi:hypothetical protein